MFDTNTPSDRLLKAALEVAAAKPWQDATLAEIAEKAGLDLGSMRDLYASKADILRGILRAIDDAVVKAAPRPAADQAKRDALFEVLMTRFDLLAPHKSALKSIYASGMADFSLAAPYLASQHWMLQAAGIGTDGVGGSARVAGLALIYARVFRTWLSDDDAGLGKTMAALDRHLRRGESALQGVVAATSALGRFATIAREAVRTARKKTDTGSAATASPAGAPPPDAPAPAGGPGSGTP